tara:strand:+ start:7360 stop:8010 length:651 start_codon:yes stop_codon:yes gene_type:complete
MRIKLEPYEGTYVLCKGWIKSWKDINHKQPQRKLLISQPTIREPNRDLMFNDLPIISTEHHINLFINQEDLATYTNSFDLNSTIEFSGIIQGYMRTDGSIDYGIYPNQQSLLHLKLEALRTYYPHLAKEVGVWNEEFYSFSQSAKRGLLTLSQELESAGDQLPTFIHTYKWYRSEIDDWLFCCDYCIKRIETACSSRALRRKNKIKTNFTKQFKTG